MENLLAFDNTVYAKILAAVLLGFAVGLEREMTNKYAGLRTNILVCLGACVFTIISIYGFPTVMTSLNANGIRDTARVAAQVVTGIGFIGGGTVLRHGSSVFGLTTAATLWMSASIGMACGAGMYSLAIFATVVSIIVLVSVRMFETNILKSSTKNTKRLKINLTCNSENAEEIYGYIIDHFVNIREITKKASKSCDSLTKIAFIIDLSARKPIQSLYKSFQCLEGLEAISIQEPGELA